MERNFETVMIEQCAPVLAGLKPAGLFRYETRDCADLAARVHRWNDQLGEKGLKVRVLKGCAQTHRYLIYVYRCVRCWPMRRCGSSCNARAMPCRKMLPIVTVCCGSCPGGCAARPIFPMRSACFLVIRSPMWWALSKIRAATSPAAAAGKPTGTRRRHSVTLHSCASVQPCICDYSTAVPPFSALLWRLNTDILFSKYSLFILAPAGVHALAGKKSSF